ncbi:hypothetical protein LguiB_020694 [Lonicera macranthoides]
MTELRLLEIHNACIPKGPDYLPDELRWIDWDKYPSNALPAMFEADALVGLRLHCSRLKQLWEGRTAKTKFIKSNSTRTLRNTINQDFTAYGEISKRMKAIGQQQMWCKLQWVTSYQHTFMFREIKLVTYSARKQSPAVVLMESDNK